MNKVNGYGPAQADIVIVGEAPGEDEELEGRPFVGASGHLLTTMLREAGIDPRACYVTNVCKYRPPANKIETWLTDKKKTGKANEWEFKDERYYSEEISEGLGELRGEILGRQPRIIIGLGNTALWALSGEWGILDWRGSEMGVALSTPDGIRTPFVPTLHPASILRNWPTRPFAAHDFKQRVSRRLKTGFVTPDWDFNYEPTLADALSFIDALAGDVAVDVETSRGRIVCVGLGVSATRAMCIPFISEGYGAYWSALDAQIIVAALKAKLLSPSINVVGQNFNYDASYFDDNFDFIPRVAFDTLIAQSVLFPGTPRGLGYLSSMYCDWHCYWKDDARDWSNLKDFDRLFKYNCRDVCATWEAAQKQRLALARANLSEQFMERMTYNHHVYDMMQRGVIRDDERTRVQDEAIGESLHERKLIICDAAGRDINLLSPPQVSKFLYDDLGCRRPARRGKEAGGTGKKEIPQLLTWHPEHKDVLMAIMEYRSLNSVRTNFLRAVKDPDDMLRSSFMATGTETFRPTSSKNNFGRGCNLLNISKGDDDTDDDEDVIAPAYRTVIVPPPGYGMFDCDLEKADVWAVAAESQDAYLFDKLRSGNLHKENAKDLFGLRSVAEVTDHQYARAKKFVHLTNYGGKSRTCAIGCGMTVHESDMAQRKWFATHPGILKWHERYAELLKNGRTITNAFGYRCVYFDRVDGLLPEALAWTPQSTVAIVASLVHMNIDNMAKERGIDIQVWLQMYDSVMGIYKLEQEEEAVALLWEATQVAVPYPEPMIIPMGLNRSTVSWGDCKSDKRGWPK